MPPSARPYSALVAARLDLDLVDELVVDGLALEALDDVGRVDAVDDPLVLDGGRPVDRQSERPSLRLPAIGADAGVGAHDVGVVARHRELRNDLVRVIRPGSRRGHVHERNFARHGDGFPLDDLQFQIQSRRRVERHRNRFLDGLEAREGGHDEVLARRHGQNPVLPVAPRGLYANALHPRASPLDRHTGQRRAGSVGDRPLDVARRLGGKRQGRHQEQQDEKKRPRKGCPTPGHSPPPRFAWKRQVGRAPLAGPFLCETKRLPGRFSSTVNAPLE